MCDYNGPISCAAGHAEPPGPTIGFLLSTIEIITFYCEALHHNYSSTIGEAYNEKHLILLGLFHILVFGWMGINQPCFSQIYLAES